MVIAMLLPMETIVDQIKYHYGAPNLNDTVSKADIIQPGIYIPEDSDWGSDVEKNTILSEHDTFDAAIDKINNNPYTIKAVKERPDVPEIIKHANRVISGPPA